jgi:hypothetical protein
MAKNQSGVLEFMSYAYYTIRLRSFSFELISPPLKFYGRNRSPNAQAPKEFRCATRFSPTMRWADPRSLIG